MYSETCLKWPLSEYQKLVFKTDYRLMQVKSIAGCSKGSILQYFRPSIRCHLLFRSLFCLFLSGRFTQVLLYVPFYCLSRYYRKYICTARTGWDRFRVYARDHHTGSIKGWTAHEILIQCSPFIMFGLESMDHNISELCYI